MPPLPAPSLRRWGSAAAPCARPPISSAVTAVGCQLLCFVVSTLLLCLGGQGGPGPSSPHWHLYITSLRPHPFVYTRGSGYVPRQPLRLPETPTTSDGRRPPGVLVIPAADSEVRTRDAALHAPAPPPPRRDLVDVVALLPVATVAVLTLLMTYTFRKLVFARGPGPDPERPEDEAQPRRGPPSRPGPAPRPLPLTYDFPQHQMPLLGPHLDGPSDWQEAPSRLPALLNEEDIDELEILPVSDLEFREEAMVVEYCQDGSRAPQQRWLKTSKQCKALMFPPSDAGILRWVNVTGNQNALKLPILQAYDIHPLFIEDILNEAERSKVENLGSHELVFLFQTVNLVEEADQDDDDTEDDIRILKLEMSQISLILRDSSLLSFFAAPSKTVETCKALIASGGGKLRTTSTHWLMHSIIDKEVDRLFPLMNRYRAQLEAIQRALDNRRPKHRTGNPNVHYAKLLRALQTTSQEMNNLIFILRPLASSVASLTEHAKNLQMWELQWHFNDLRDHIATILDYVASMQAWARALKDDYSYIQQDSMNRTMYALTLITALFIPAQFLTGLFGMNFQYMPWLTWKYGFVAFWAVIAVINGAIIYTFKKIRWL
eukprot:EG_transcript_6797